MYPQPSFSRWCRIGAWFVVSLVLFASASAAPDRTKPTTPSNLRVTAVTSSSVSLTWNAASDNSGSFTYHVREINSGQVRAVAPPTTSLVWAGLQASRTYRFLVYARDAAGNQSGNSNTVTATTSAPPPLLPPANVRVAEATITTLRIAWDASAGATHYEVRIDGRVYPTANATTYVFGSLLPGTAYEIALRAWGAGVTTWTAPLIGTTATDTVAPTAPVVSARALSPGMMEVTWTPSTDDNGYVGYNVYLNGKPARSMLPHNLTPRSVTIQNLRAQTAYQVEVRAHDRAGNLSAAVTPVLLTMPVGTDTQALAAPGNLRVQPWVNGISSVALMWDWPSDNVGVTAFEILREGVVVGEVVTDIHYGDLFNWFFVRHLAPGSTHTFVVRARDEAGNVSPPSNPFTVTMLPSTDTISPTPPTSLTGSTTPGFTFLDFQWMGATDNDPAGQLEYEVWTDDGYLGVFNWEAFEGLFGRHRYHLRAVDRAGNTSGASNTVILESALGYGW
ncbi:MAG TPA: fibronectin type III domain-containing protein [Lacunisphaera sp.]|nr:fibronectin type III domain-containing protein [Lacunisphaera sp.]